MGDSGSTTPIAQVFSGGRLEGRNRPIRETPELTDEIQRVRTTPLEYDERAASPCR